MKDRKTNVWDFMCDHPFISMMIISSICETVGYIIRPRRKESVRYIFSNEGNNEEATENMKECGSTEQEEN